MTTNSKYGNKERLFRLMYGNEVKKVISEELSLINDRELILKHFIEYVNSFLSLENNIPKITISYSKDDAKKNKSFGGYLPYEKEIIVVGANRNLADVLRSLAHELVHHKQNLDGRIKNDSGETGSIEENEANSLAGVILRNYGKINPNIFE